jgi:hypothetical protein
MARIGVSITKSVAFRNSTQEFSNVYYYTNVGGALPDSTQADAIIDAIVVLEKSFHSTGVTFVRGRLWSQVGSPGSNNMISQKNLSGTGARALVAAMDKERAFLFRIRAGNDSRGQPVYLRKWFHACGVFYNAQSIADSHLANTAAFTSGERESMRAQMAGLLSVSAGGSVWTLCSKGGRDPSAGETFSAHQFLEHHQLGDQWRAQ